MGVIFNAMKLKEISELPILIGNLVFLLDGAGVYLLELHNFLLEGLDVNLLSFTVSSMIRKKQHNGSTIRYIYLCACLFSSCRRVRAGLLSGFGPRRLDGWPSILVLDDKYA